MALFGSIPRGWLVSAIIALAAMPAWGQSQGAKDAASPTPSATPAGAPAADERPDNETCLSCHGEEGFSAEGPNGRKRDLHVKDKVFGGSVHGKQLCVDCHRNMAEIPHEPGTRVQVSCVQCHQDLWQSAQKEGKTKDHPRLGVVVEQIEHFMKSVHARPSRADQSRTNATCYNCHDAHSVYPLGSTERAEWRLSIPNKCGACHTGQLGDYARSVHGVEVLKNSNPVAAICSDCHTTHDVASPALDSSKLAITTNCGNCHQDSLRTYRQTYHGQVARLGFAYTAKCFDCHGSHGIQRVADPVSKVHADNRLATCRQCHTNATAGFVTFLPHGDPSDRKNYPVLWATTVFMLALLAGVFAFFWSHVALWFHREWKERKAQLARPHVEVDALPPQFRGKQFERFALPWRIAHLLLLLSVMTLVLTGTSVLFAHTDWAPAVMQYLGSPKVAALLHRIAAGVFIAVFAWHLVYLTIRMSRTGKPFDIFGPNSLVPNLQDMNDIVAMFKWFFGQGPRPRFDRWTYWEKFDYWAVFWGVGVIGGSGLILWFPAFFASFLPGWVFNVATIFHGEEAILAAVFLFTVHFFNNHFRPDKFPLDVVMFTGRVSLEEFRREHTLEYNRLAASGELQKYLVDEPSRPLSLGSRILGFTLITIGLVLLVLVVTGWFGLMFGEH
jgi:cytochrome b subunit of formate dehydrogenase